MIGSDSHRDAVRIRQLCFSYSNCDRILDDIELSVPRTRIYGLLGPSGCGKTTLLKCILGRLKPDSGDICIFGDKPSKCHIPGAGVGYMPQEIALYQDFTIGELLRYFGRIFAMNCREIEAKIQELINLLQLPKKSTLIGKISGGQQRRTSLACALIHSPPLLILDEPTVGTDPILRQTIWYHLKWLCRSGLTIILTTHYIEEARSADTVAFMRCGKILAEDNPNLLLDKYLMTSLEDVFLRLCHLDGKIGNNSDDISLLTSDKKETKIYYENQLSLEEKEDTTGTTTVPSVNSSSKSSSLILQSSAGSADCDNKSTDQSLDMNGITSDNNIHNNIKHNNCVYIKITDESVVTTKTVNNTSVATALDVTEKLLLSTTGTNAETVLSIKNFKDGSLKDVRRLLPALQVALLLISISSGPTDLNLAVIDEESRNNRTNNWGELFLQCLDNRTFNIKHYDSFEAAIGSVESGHSYAAVEINDRFSAALRLRHLYGNDADEETIEDSQIRIHIDWSNQAIGAQIERNFYDGMKRFAEEVAVRSNINPDTIKVPMVFEQPVYGHRDESMRDYVLPGCYILLAFFATSAVTSHLIMDERRDGLIERSLVAGVTAFEFLLSHALTQFLILMMQISFMLLMPHLLFHRPLNCSLSAVIALALSQGFCGITFGLMISAISSDIIYAAMFIICMFFVSIIIG
ncbi:unnamed protein product, partial [Medioppia subpectinata]